MLPFGYSKADQSIPDPLGLMGSTFGWGLKKLNHSSAQTGFALRYGWFLSSC